MVGEQLFLNGSLNRIQLFLFPGPKYTKKVFPRCSLNQI